MVFALPIKPSQWLRRLRCVQFTCALLAVCFVDWPIMAQAAIMTLIVVYGCRKNSMPEALLFDAHGLTIVENGVRTRARLGSQCHCNEFIVVLSIVAESERTRCASPLRIVLLPDSSSVESLRKLRLYLRWSSIRSSA